MDLKLFEINVAVRNVNEAVNSYVKLFADLGLNPGQQFEVEKEPIQAKFNRIPLESTNGSKTFLSMMESTAPDSPIDRFIKTRGEGLFSLSFKVPDLDKVSSLLARKGIRTFPSTPVDFLSERTVWIHPKESATHGVLLELHEESSQ
jgi:methylmalonyl-CoA/ethylmalonyl-CoA epimerase